MAQFSRRCAIIGGPSSGKTSIIDVLRGRGFATVQDMARILLTDKSVIKPTVDRHAFQSKLLLAQIAAEEQANFRGKNCFVDGGIFDGCAYYICDGLAVPPMYDSFAGSRYYRAFLIKSLDNFVEDGVRYQNSDFTKIITPIFEQVYTARGIKVIHVPKLPLEQRVELILAEMR